MRFNGLAIIASVALLGACGGDKSKDAAPTDSATTPTATNPAATTTAPVATVPAAPATGKTWEIKMIGDATNNVFKFEPANITIKQGDNVKFIMVSGGPHNVTFDQAQVPAAAQAQLKANMPTQMSDFMGPFMQGANETYEISFAKIPAGTYPFLCTPHLAMNMKGSITVQ